MRVINTQCCLYLSHQLIVQTSDVESHTISHRVSANDRTPKIPRKDYTTKEVYRLA